MKKFLFPSILTLAICVILYFILGNIGGVLPAHINSADTVVGYLMNFSVIFGVILGFWKKDAFFKYFQKWKTKPEFINVGEPFEVPIEKFKAAIIPVSKREQPEWIIRHLKPNYVSLVFTEQTKEYAKSLIKDFSDKIDFFPNLEDMDNPSYILSTPDNVEEAQKKAKKYIRKYIQKGIESSDIFVDTTGGKVPMSIGMFQAAEQVGVSSIYIIGTDNGLILKPDIKEHGKPVFISDHSTDYLS